MAPDLRTQGEALEACLAGLALSAALTPHLGGSTQLAVASLGQPACLPVLLIRPSLGEDKVPGQRCIFTSSWVVSAYWDLDCGLEEAQAAIYTLMSGCGVPGSILGHLSASENLAPLRAIGASIKAIEAPRGFSVTGYATDGQPNAFWAQVPVILTYTC